MSAAEKSRLRTPTASGRSASGQLAGAPDIVLLVLVAVPTLLLLINLGIFILNKIRLDSASNVGVQVFTTIAGATTTDAETAAADACVAMNIVPAAADVTCTWSNPAPTIDGQPAAALTVTVPLSLFGSELNIFPATIQLSDTAVGLVRTPNYTGTGVGIKCAHGTSSGTSLGGPSGPGAPLIWVPVEHAAMAPEPDGTNGGGWWQVNYINSWSDLQVPPGGCNNAGMGWPQAYGYAMELCPSDTLISMPKFTPGKDCQSSYAVTAW